MTADAAQTQTATAAYITGRDGHYLLPVKGNQPTLKAQVKAVLGNICTRPANDLCEERGHGRITRRRLWITTVAPAIEYIETDTAAQSGTEPSAPNPGRTRRERILELMRSDPTRSWHRREIAQWLGVTDANVICVQLSQWAHKGQLRKVDQATYTLP